MLAQAGFGRGLRAGAMADEQKPLSTSYARMLEKGQIRDPIRNIIPAGKSTGIFAAQTLEAGKKEGIAEYMQARAEQTYASTKREPLGRSINRGYNLPEEILKEKGQFSYGLAPLNADRFDGKEIIFPRGVEREREEDHDQYVFSH